MPIIIEVDLEDDGRCLAEVLGLPGVLAYGVTQEEAIARAQALGARVLADRVCPRHQATRDAAPQEQLTLG